jgi:hypothetical protein
MKRDLLRQGSRRRGKRRKRRRIRRRDRKKAAIVRSLRMKRPPRNAGFKRYGLHVL